MKNIALQLFILWCVFVAADFSAAVVAVNYESINAPFSVTENIDNAITLLLAYWFTDIRKLNKRR